MQSIFSYIRKIATLSLFLSKIKEAWESSYDNPRENLTPVETFIQKIQPAIDNARERTFTTGLDKTKIRNEILKVTQGAVDMDTKGELFETKKVKKQTPQTPSSVHPVP